MPPTPPPQAPLAARAAVSGVRILGCLTMVLGFMVGIVAMIGGGVVALVVAGGLVVIGLAMAAISRIA